MAYFSFTTSLLRVGPLTFRLTATKIYQAAQPLSLHRVYQILFSSITHHSGHRHKGTMANSSIKLYYFDEDGRAEVSRLVLTLAGKSFDDIRFSFEEWPKLKPTMPFQQVPVLEIDDKKYAQSLAIPAYLAREFGLYGQTNLDGLNIDMIAQLVLDFRLLASKHYYEKDADKKAEIAKTLKEVESPKYLGHLERLLKENGGKYMVGNGVSLADLIVFDVFRGALGKFVADSAEQFPLLKQLVERIGNIDKIKTYIEFRK